MTIKVDDAFALIYRHTGVFRKEISQRTRRPRICNARILLMWLLREQGWRFMAIGRALKMDHTTVVKNLQNLKLKRAADPGLHEKMQEIERELSERGAKASTAGPARLRDEPPVSLFGGPEKATKYLED